MTSVPRFLFPFSSAAPSPRIHAPHHRGAAAPSTQATVLWRTFLDRVLFILVDDNAHADERHAETRITQLLHAMVMVVGRQQFESKVEALRRELKASFKLVDGLLTESTYLGCHGISPHIPISPYPPRVIPMHHPLRSSIVPWTCLTLSTVANAITTVALQFTRSTAWFLQTLQAYNAHWTGSQMQLKPITRSS